MIRYEVPLPRESEGCAAGVCLKNPAEDTLEPPDRETVSPAGNGERGNLRQLLPHRRTEEQADTTGMPAASVFLL
jgi:hypothetical protein